MRASGKAVEFRLEQLVESSPETWEFFDLARAGSPIAALESVVAREGLHFGRYRCVATDGTVTDLALDGGGVRVIRR
jgi:hypothetical protein